MRPKKLKMSGFMKYRQISPKPKVLDDSDVVRQPSIAIPFIL